MADLTMKEAHPPEAWEILQTNHDATLLDVRTSMEYEYVGHPLNAVNVPWMESPDWQIEKDFVERVKEVLVHKKGDGDVESLPLLIICRSGKRSEAAAKEMLKQGFTDVYNILEGFEGDRDGEKHRNTINGWRHHNLPWEQS